MALKFLNKKGWHTGSLRNIENVWKAEQKHDAEQRKLEELRKQIHEEREKAEFRLLQEQAGLVPRQERLDFLYDSGLAVGKSSSEGFKSLESLPPKSEPETSASENKAATPGALFEDKPQSANDAWRKLHSDPLLLIKQREQEALARVKNNPVQMAMIRKSVEAKKKHKEKASDGEKHKHKKSKHEKHKSSSSKHHVNSDEEEEDERKSSKHKEDVRTERVRNDGDERYHRDDRSDSRSSKRDREDRYDSRSTKRDDREDRYDSRSNKRDDREDRTDSRSAKRDDREDRFDSRSTKRDDREDRDSRVAKRDDREDGHHRPPIHHRKVSDAPLPPPHNHHRRNRNVEISKEDRAKKLKEMQMDAELHEEQRWKRLKQAEDDDAKEVTHASSNGRNFLDAAHKSVYGAEKGGSSTIEESVRRRTHYSQRSSGEGNAFRR